MGQLYDIVKEELRNIRNELENIELMTEHSKSMSIGAKLLITANCQKIRKQLQTIELEMDFQNHEEK